MYYAENAITKALPKVAAAVKAAKLKKAAEPLVSTPLMPRFACLLHVTERTNDLSNGLIWPKDG